VYLQSNLIFASASILIPLATRPTELTSDQWTKLLIGQPTDPQINLELTYLRPGHK